MSKLDEFLLDALFGKGTGSQFAESLRKIDEMVEEDKRKKEREKESEE